LRWACCNSTHTNQRLLPAAAAASAADAAFLLLRVFIVLQQKLGLGLLGAKLRAEWSPQEEILFALGMLEKYRNFRHMHRAYLKKRSVHELNGYYYNCWKNNATQVRHGGVQHSFSLEVR
jgi:hypothetical protein